MARTRNQARNNNGANVGYEAQLWQMADALRGSIDASEYKHIVLGLIFPKYMWEAFEELHTRPQDGKKHGAVPEDPNEYCALDILWVPESRHGLRSLAIRGIDTQIRYAACFIAGACA